MRERARKQNTNSSYIYEQKERYFKKRVLWSQHFYGPNHERDDDVAKIAENQIV